MTRLRTALVLVACQLSLPAPHWAGEAGGIVGRVTGPGGAGLGGVTVMVSELRVAEVTSADGGFAFRAIPPGTYTLLLSLGARSSRREGVVVAASASVSVSIEVAWTVAFSEALTVEGASRLRERIVEAPAAVTAVLPEQIEREAAHAQLPKLLEFTPGAEVTQSGLYDFNLNTRGFNSSLNRRVATLVDGRDPSVPSLGAQEWAGVSFPLDDVAALEFVRGPSAALHGSNASSGVVAITTKAPRDSRGGTLRLAGGGLATFNGDLRWAFGLGGEWYAKVLGGFRRSGDFTLSRDESVEYAVPCGRSAVVTSDCLPREAVPVEPEDREVYLAGLRLDKHFADGSALTLEGGFTRLEGPVLLTGIGRVQVREAQRPWVRASFTTGALHLLGDYARRDAPHQTALASGGNISLDEERAHLEGQGRWGLAGNKVRVVLGGSWKRETTDSFDPEADAQTLLVAPAEGDAVAAYGQVDWRPTERLRLVAAGRLDAGSFFDSHFSPRGSLVWGASSRHTLRLTYGEGFQAPNHIELVGQTDVAPALPLHAFEAFCTPYGVRCGFAPGPTRVLALGNDSLRTEEVRMLEIGYVGVLGSQAFLTLDYYRAKSERFVTDLLPQVGTALGRLNPDFGPYAPPAGLPVDAAAALTAALQRALGAGYASLSNNIDGTPVAAALSFANFGAVSTQGADVAVRLQLSKHCHAALSYSWFNFALAETAPGLDSLLLPNSPEHKLAATLGYAASRWDGSASLRRVAGFRWAAGAFQGDVPSYTLVDLHATVRFGERLGVGLGVSNLLDDRHWEAFGGDILGRRALVHASLGW